MMGSPALKSKLTGLLTRLFIAKVMTSDILREDQSKEVTQFQAVNSYMPVNATGLKLLWSTLQNNRMRAWKNNPSLFMILLLLAGDIEQNPGPAVKYPCGHCTKPAKTDCVACDTCDTWYHRKCVGMRPEIFRKLGNASWHCLTCALPNVSIFLDSSINSSKSRFDSLYEHSSSLDASFNPPPSHCSSPKNDKIIQKQNQKNHRRPMKTCIINFQSVNNKKADILHLIETETPDIIAGSETWLNSSVSSSEIFPANYNIYRSDRLKGSHGGALLALNAEYTAERIETSQDLEAVFVKINTQKGKPPLIVGSVYRPTNKYLQYSNLLCNTIEKLQRKHKKASFWLCGDFNLPDVTWESHTINGHQYPREINQRFLDMLHTCGLTQMVEEPTREKNILDLFITNRPSLMKSCTVSPGLSDHHMVVTQNYIIAQRRKPLPRKIYLWKRANYTMLKENVTNLEKEIRDKYQEKVTINELWTFFLKKIREIQDKCVPSKTASVRFHQPWITTDIKRLSRSKRRAFRRAKTTNKPADWDRYKELKKRTRQLSKHTYHQFLNNLMTDESNDQPQIYNKRFWAYIKSRQTENIGISSLKDAMGRVLIESKAKASLLNDQFTSVFVSRSTSPSSIQSQSDYPCIADFNITSDGIQKLLQNLKIHKAPGPDELSPQLLKSVAAEVSPILKMIFDSSLEQGCVPDDWKHAKVSPIFKKGDREKAENYRPVSLTSVVCKVMEHILSSQINRHLEMHGILCDPQHGFRQRRSCETQLISTLTDFVNTTEEKGQCDVILLDFSKAFDKVSHSLLLQKLHRYGIDGRVHT